MTIDDFKKILASGHLYKSLYHFTDTANLSSISTYGLVSKEEAERSGITVAVYGGNVWSHDADAHKGLQDYVNLCFTQSHPMCHAAFLDGRIPNPRYLPISPDVLHIEGVKITLDVANKSGVSLLDIEEGLEQLDKQVLYTRTDWNDSAIQERLRGAEKCEILVPKRVPIQLITI